MPEMARTSIIETLEACEEYFEQRADAEYFTDSPGAVGNEEMHLLVQVQDALRSARKQEAA